MDIHKESAFNVLRGKTAEAEQVVISIHNLIRPQPLRLDLLDLIEDYAARLVYPEETYRSGNYSQYT